MIMIQENKSIQDNSQSLQMAVSGSVMCDFCSAITKREDLLKNGHCPKCQSPTTKNK